jgi:hypothetical protein
MNRDETDNEGPLDKVKGAVNSVLGGRDSGESAEAGTTPASDPAGGAGVVEYNRAAGVDTIMSDAREGPTLGDYGITGQTDSYHGADVAGDVSETPERADLG